MTIQPGRGMRGSRVAGFGVLVTVGFLAAWPEAVARLESWRTESASAFRKGQRDRVVVSDSGTVRLGQALAPVGKLEASRVWDLVRSRAGAVYAATGDQGKVLRRPGDGTTDWSVALDADDSQVLSLAIGPDNHVFAGTGPSGQVIDVDDPRHPGSRPGPGVEYIWDLASDAQGTLYAATGPNGQLWKRTPAGAWSVLFDSRHSHLLCVIVTRDGSIITGSDGEGIVYRIGPDGKAAVLYDAAQSEVRCLLEGPDGTIYAGTAADSSGGSGRGPITFPSNTNVTGTLGANPAASVASAGSPRAQGPGEGAQAKPKSAESGKDSSSGSGGTATPRPVSPGENAVYRIDPSGAVREIFRARALVFSLVFDRNRLLVGTGPEGQLYAVSDADRESTPIARLDNGHILALLGGTDQPVLIGTADPGSVVQLEPGHVASGSLLSEVKDAKLISRFGAVSWRADTPNGTTVKLQIRTGNVAEPDSTWSDWSRELTRGDDSQPEVRAGRFVQYRATLTTTDSKVTPEIRSVTLRYQSTNLPPEIGKLDIPDIAAADGSSRQSRLTFKWEVSDPNDDDLHYNVFLRKEGWPDWVRLNEQALTDKSLAWDSTSVPPGYYRVRIEANDRPSNGPADALRTSKESDTFIVDHEAPGVTVTPQAGKARVALRDRLTRIVKASYSVDGGEWVPVFSDDGLFDTASETVTIDLARLAAGTHVVMIRATDAAGNVGSGDALVTIP
ncbi:MAG: WD40 repeat domain-containing protein [Isosphaeraceae bacterium]